MASLADPARDWTRCKHWIEAALAESAGTHSMEDVIDGLVSGEFQFWPSTASACITEIVEYPRRKALIFWLAGGDLEDMMTTIEPVARAWGEQQGCNLFLGNAVDRPGWTRALAKYGYAPGWRVFRRSECR